MFIIIIFFFNYSRILGARKLQPLRPANSESNGDRYFQNSTVFHFAVRLFGYRSQMNQKCGKNQKVANEPKGNW